MTIDCSYKNKNGPGRYRSAADNPDEQVCYFNKLNGDEYYNVFISTRIKAEDFSEGIYFKTEIVRGKTGKDNFDSKKTLEDGASNDRLSNIFSISKSEQTGAGAGKRHEAPLQKRKKVSKTQISLRTVTTFQKNKKKENSKIKL